MKIAIAQINTITGNIGYNAEKIKEYSAKAKEQGAELVVFPQLSLPGGFAKDLYLRKDFLNNCESVINKLAKELSVPVVFGCAYRGENAAVYIKNGQADPVAFKTLFGREKKYFNGNALQINADGFSCCVYSGREELMQSAKQADELSSETLIVLANEPFYAGRKEEILAEILECAGKFSLNIAFANGVGGQDGFVCFGSSFAVNKGGFVESYAKQFSEDLIFADFILSSQVYTEETSAEQQVYDALVLGLKDYVSKNGFKKIVLGVSGGVDSALVAVIAKDALGPENVTGIFMPSEFTSKQSKDDAELLCKINNIKLLDMPINGIFKAFKSSLSDVFKGTKRDLTEENLQSRIRGVLLMAYSNKFNALVVNTGNKSEIAAGYSTLYGDSVGGYGAICDLEKTFLYKICAYRNSVSPDIPQSIIDREPTAELRENQKDSDSLPPYDILDAIIEKYTASFDCADETKLSNDEKQIFNTISRAEYKRRQLPFGTKVSKQSLNDIIIPVTNGYKND